MTRTWLGHLRWFKEWPLLTVVDKCQFLKNGNLIDCTYDDVEADGARSRFSENTKDENYFDNT